MEDYFLYPAAFKRILGDRTEPTFEDGLELAAVYSEWCSGTDGCREPEALKEFAENLRQMKEYS